MITLPPKPNANTQRGGRFYSFVVRAGQTLPINIAGRCFMVLSSLLPLFIAPDGTAQSLYWEGLGLFAQDPFLGLQVSIPSSITFNGTAPTSFTIWLWIGYDLPLVEQQFRPYYRTAVFASGIPGTAVFLPDRSGTFGNVSFLGDSFQGGNNILVPVIATRRHKIIISSNTVAGGNTPAVYPMAGGTAGSPYYVPLNTLFETDVASDFEIRTDLGSDDPAYFDIYETIPNCPN